LWEVAAAAEQAGNDPLPELPKDADVRVWTERHFACRVIAVFPAPTSQHAFSNFKLSIELLICTIANSHAELEPTFRWVRHNELMAAGFPAPIRRFLESIPSR
jgi:hypothetical protein